MIEFGIYNKQQRNSIRAIWPSNLAGKENYTTFYNKMPLNIYTVLRREYNFTYDDITRTDKFWCIDSYCYSGIKDKLEKYKGYFDVQFKANINIFRKIFTDRTGCLLTNFLFRNLIEYGASLSNFSSAFDSVDKGVPFFGAEAEIKNGYPFSEYEPFEHYLKNVKNFGTITCNDILKEIIQYNKFINKTTKTIKENGNDGNNENQLQNEVLIGSFGSKQKGCGICLPSGKIISGSGLIGNGKVISF